MNKVPPPAPRKSKKRTTYDEEEEQNEEQNYTTTGIRMMKQPSFYSDRALNPTENSRSIRRRIEFGDEEEEDEDNTTTTTDLDMILLEKTLAIRVLINVGYSPLAKTLWRTMISGKPLDI